jgi:allantoate deiminase
MGKDMPEADPRRIARFLREVGEVGRDPRGGWSRLAFSQEERQAHALFERWAADLGLSTRTDAIGNTFAEHAGNDDSRPALMSGSHLDTVPQGGGFDGSAGVAAALEVARLLSEAGGTSRPYRAVVFSGEEGARFGAPCIGSRIATGDFTSATLRELSDREGHSAAESAEELGLRPSDVAEAVWSRVSVEAFMELHIEQGRVLESRGVPLGVVDAIAGSTRAELSFSGHTDHSGATPMPLRSDALVGASEFVVEVERRAAAYPTTVATVGRLEVEPGSFTSVPGLARLALDVRDVDSERQRELLEELLDQATRIAARRSLELSAVLVSDQSPVVLHKPVRERLAKAALERGVPLRVLPSGATHDAAHVARVTPTGLLFVPSRGGLSHTPEEWSRVEDIAHGAEVIAAALVGLDEEEAK